MAGTVNKLMEKNPSKHRNLIKMDHGEVCVRISFKGAPTGGGRPGCSPQPPKTEI
jgi:hypothetical protein